MTRHSIAKGMYRDRQGNFWIRPNVSGRRTWIRLPAATQSDAAQAAAALRTDHARSQIGLCRDPFAEEHTFDEAARECIAKTGRKSLPARLLTCWGSKKLYDITLQAAEVRGKSFGNRTRAADIELAAVSAVLSWAVGKGWLVKNPLLGRKRCHSAKTVRHARDCMPENGDELHHLARALLSKEPRAVGWQCILAALTGLRTSELLALRTDASRDGEPGFIAGNTLHVRRRKEGMLVGVELTAELRECIEAHRVWHSIAGGSSRWWFPGAGRFLPLSRLALTQALSRLGGPKRTAHGLRSYFVTVWRSRGLGNAEVAARIGDKSSGLIETTYGRAPEKWEGGKALSWLPSQGEPAWAPWVPHRPGNVVNFA